MSVLTGLYFLVFKPTIALIEKREHSGHGLKTESEELIAQTKEALALYEKKMADARSQAITEREAIIESARVLEREIIGKARIEVDAVLGEIKKQISIQKKEAELQLRQYAQELAKKMVDKVLAQAA